MKHVTWGKSKEHKQTNEQKRKEKEKEGKKVGEGILRVVGVTFLHSFFVVFE